MEKINPISEKEKANRIKEKFFGGTEKTFKNLDQSLEEIIAETYELSKIIERTQPGGDAEITYIPTTGTPVEMLVTEKVTGKLLFHENLEFFKERIEELEAVEVLVKQEREIREKLIKGDNSLVN